MIFHTMKTYTCNDVCFEVNHNIEEGIQLLVKQNEEGGYKTILNQMLDESEVKNLIKMLEKSLEE